MRRPIEHRLIRITHGFTLVELLVVMGIIAILIGVLIPVIASVRRAAYATDSRNQIKNVGNAIDRYYQDHSAYPGVFSNAQILTAGGLTPTGATGRLSQTENMMLSLAGGLNAAGAGYVTADVGRGPLTYGSPQKRLSPYVEVNSQFASVSGSLLDQGGRFGVGEAMGANIGIPEFVDRFPGGLPIIYIRAKVGATTVTASDGTAQYDLREISIYSAGTFAVPAAPTPDFVSWNAYLVHPSISTSAKRQDSYVLISPGEDRKYGTSDDICNFSF